MVNSLKDAFERARKKQIGESGKEEVKSQSFEEQLRQSITVPVNESDIRKGNLTLSGKGRQREKTIKNVKVSYGHVTPRSPRKKQHVTQYQLPVVKLPKFMPSKPAGALPIVVPPVEDPTPRATHTVSVSTTAAFALTIRDQDVGPLLLNVGTMGRATQVHVGKLDDKREVVLGLDFGTSCVKVVIGDAALGKAFAVPSCKAEGIARFLLPSRLYQTGKSFSLDAGTHVYRDLKLSLLANPEDSILQQRVVAFLALVILRARGWLLMEHAASYKRTGIVWKLAVGIPSAQHLQTPLSKLLERLSLAAWTVAGGSAVVSDELIQSVLDQNPSVGRNDDDVEITVVPEIAAQIYGFVASNSFDKNAANIFLMADVGAGTVDSALFHVKLGKGGRWDFEFFTSVVEPNGVSNLHRHRVNWWKDELVKVLAPQQLLDDLTTSKLMTDQQLLSPESFLDYFDGVQVKFEGSVKTPDESFFSQRVLAQVQGKTFYRTLKNNLLPKQSLSNVPFFMCGGGVRMGYYQALEPRLASIPGYTWLTAECRVMGVPEDLVADGIAKNEYDRLSVAYGLSRLEVGKIVKALPQPKLDVPLVNNWRDNYIDKDQC